jgi:hypothetical protein
MEQISRIGMDTSKHIFQVHGVNTAEQPVLRKKLRFQSQGRSTWKREVRCWTILHKDRRARPADGRRWIAPRPLVSKSIGRQQSQISAFYH